MDDLLGVNTIHNLWRQLVNDYTQREMTVEGDKMIAISGLARMFCQVLSMLPDPKGQGNPTPIYFSRHLEEQHSPRLALDRATSFTTVSRGA